MKPHTFSIVHFPRYKYTVGGFLPHVELDIEIAPRLAALLHIEQDGLDEHSMEACCARSALILPVGQRLLDVDVHRTGRRVRVFCRWNGVLGSPLGAAVTCEPTRDAPAPS